MDDSISIHSQPANSKEVVERFEQLDEGKAKQLVIDILLSEELTKQYCEALGSKERLLEGGHGSDFARGCALFLAFQRYATLPDTERDCDLLNRVAQDDRFQHFFKEFHRIPDNVGLRNLSFHASGTTSFIFKASTRGHGPTALKVIQAPYVRLAAIQIATKGYAKTFGHHTKYSPEVYDSSENLDMDGVSGRAEPARFHEHAEG